MTPLRVRATLRRCDAMQAAYETEFVVGPIGMNIVAPASALIRAGIQRYRNENFGIALIEILGELNVGHVIFGADETEPMMGHLLFDSFCFIVDPVTGSIVGKRPRPLKGIHLPHLR